ncbi:MAG: S-adenosyl-l-methionine hydroxide adenosyltransferase family protein [Candidatus Bathyarchaeota archaeon]|nr:MAG: S-adenosyl-l-methionine hydroxide adenosyltransferase family protein [Candidatus Bathyarchaeota archaeon]
MDEVTVSIITLLSDFGLSDPYVAEMKAIILSIHPRVFIVDITHNITKFNIRVGAFVLASAAPYFSARSIHVAVVDPGVGTKRRAIIVETKRSYYVGPDNGLVMLAAQREGIRHVYHVNNPQYMLPRISRTFHGRDIFAPAAAHLAKGSPPSEFGPEIKDYSFPEFARPRVRKGCLIGEVLYIDDFGNVVTNLLEKDLKKMDMHDECALCVRLNDKMLTLRLCSAYGQVPAGTPLAIIGSSDFLEVSVNQGSASRMFKVKIGDSLQVSLQSSN